MWQSLKTKFIVSFENGSSRQKQSQVFLCVSIPYKGPLKWIHFVGVQHFIIYCLPSVFNLRCRQKSPHICLFRLNYSHEKSGQFYTYLLYALRSQFQLINKTAKRKRRIHNFWVGSVCGWTCSFSAIWV